MAFMRRKYVNNNCVLKFQLNPVILFPNFNFNDEAI